MADVNPLLIHAYKWLEQQAYERSLEEAGLKFHEFMNRRYPKENQDALEAQATHLSE